MMPVPVSAFCRWATWSGLTREPQTREDCEFELLELQSVTSFRCLLQATAASAGQTCTAADQPVERFTTSDLVSATEETPPVDAVWPMMDAQIHRVVVVDSENRLRGLISATDVLAA